jgi:hypothetical protein
MRDFLEIIGKFFSTSWQRISALMINGLEVFVRFGKMITKIPLKNQVAQALSPFL